MNLCVKCKQEISTYYPNICVVCQNKYCNKCIKQCKSCKQYYCKSCRKYYRFNKGVCIMCDINNKKCIFL